MLKKILFFLFPLLFLFIASTFLGYQIGLQKKAPVTTLPEKNQEGIHYLEEELFTETPEEKHFKIKEDQGYVALFEVDSSGKEFLLERYDTPVSTLRSADIKLLKMGITVSSHLLAEETLENFLD